MAIDDDLNETLRNLDRTLNNFASNASKAAGNKKSVKQTLDHNASLLSSSFKLLHGHVDDFAYSMDRAAGALGRFLEIAAIGEVFHVIVDTATKLTGTYRKMIDVGETFGGSMFQMAQMAGESGLSLEQFTEAVTKHSTVSAVLISHQEGTSNAFVQLQKSIRDNLKAHSYYGMTLSQLNDTALDYMDVLARTGALERMDTNEQSMAVQGMITSATGFAAAAGKSRDEILKSATDIMREPMFVNWKAMFQPKVQGALDQLVLGLTSIGGKEFGQGFSRIMSDMLGAQNVNNPLVKAFMNSGMLSNLNLYAPLQREAIVDQKAPGVETIETMRRDLLEFRANNGRAQLQNLATWDPESANLLAQHYNQLETLVGTEAAYQRTLKRFNDALAKSEDPMTRAALEFESNFHEITGAIQDSFYNGIVKALMGSVGDADHAVDNVDKMMDQLADNLKPFGEALGQFMGWILEVLPKAASVIKGVLSIFDKIETQISKFTHIDKGWLSLGAILTPLAIKIFGKLFGGGLRARTVNLYAESVVPRGLGGGRGGAGGGGGIFGGGGGRGGGGAAERGFGGIFGGGGWTPVEPPKRGFRGFMSRTLGEGSTIGKVTRGVGRLGRFGRVGVGAIGGLLADTLGNWLIESLTPEKFQKPLESLLSGAATGGSIGFAVGGPIGALIGGAVGAVGELLIENTPSQEEIKKQLSAYVAPSLNKNQQDQQQQLDAVKQDLVDAQTRARQDQQNGDITSMKEDMAKVARLSEEIRNLQMIQAKTNKDSKQALEDLSNGSWMANAPAGGW